MEDDLRDAYYIDTREGAVGVFACPEAVSDYSAWLEGQYDKSAQSVPYGVAQKVAVMVNAAKNGADLIALGPFAGSAAKFIESVSKNSVIVEVI